LLMCEVSVFPFSNDIAYLVAIFALQHPAPHHLASVMLHYGCCGRYSSMNPQPKMLTVWKREALRRKRATYLNVLVQCSQAVVRVVQVHEVRLVAALATRVFSSKLMPPFTTIEWH
jgi:hypothetical protein